ncbi:MAG: helix-turn-helix domain-containing protein [Nitrososphaerota archaeon]|nr:helix-turn-helix domain-containing protein [Candidatus Calditenuaceae archaeon]MDW8073068.1 helix-turn-helix domain-containing protein [Nitrososphaerota archaeon]
MLLPSEVEARVLLPVLRAAVVTILVREHGFQQKQVAKALGITQPTVSNYLRMSRGKMRELLETPQMRDVAEEIAAAVLSGEDEMELRELFQRGLERLRRERVLCLAHKTLEPVLDIDSCHICD